MSHGGKAAQSLLSWRQGAPPSQAMAERSEMPTRLMTTQILSGMEGLRPFCQTNNDGRGAISTCNDANGFDGHIPVELLSRNGGNPLQLRCPMGHVRHRELRNKWNVHQ
jgi:hypothetical protein